MADKEAVLAQLDEGFKQVEDAVRNGEIPAVKEELAPSTGNSIGTSEQESARLEKIFNESKKANAEGRKQIGRRPDGDAGVPEDGPPNATDDVLAEIDENLAVGQGRRQEQRVERPPAAERQQRRQLDPILDVEDEPAAKASSDANEKAWRAELTQRSQAVAAEKAQIDMERRDMRDAAKLLLDTPIEALLGIGHTPEQLVEHFKKSGLLKIVEEEIEISKEELENLSPLERRLVDLTKRLNGKVSSLSSQLSQVGNQVARREIAEASSVGQQRREATMSGLKGYLTKSVSGSAISNSAEAKRLLVTLSMARIGSELHKAPSDPEEQKRWAIGVLKDVARNEGLLGGKRGAAQAAVNSRDGARPPIPVRSGRTLGVEEREPAKHRVFVDPEQRKAAGLAVLARLAGEA